MCGFGQDTPGFGNTNSLPSGLFGQPQSQSTGTGLFGSNCNQQQQQQSGFGFGATNNVNNTPVGSLFGQPSQNQGGAGLFGNSNVNNGARTLFGQPSQSQNPGGLFGSNQSNYAPSGLFGRPSQSQGGGGLFGSNNANQQQQPGCPFGSNANTICSNTINNNVNNATGGGLFGHKPQSQTNGSSTTGFNQESNPSGGLFGRQQSGPGLFDTIKTTAPGSSSTAVQAGGSFHNQQPSSNVFGNASHGGAIQSCFSITYPPQAFVSGTHNVPSVEKYTEKDANRVNVYQHISCTARYGNHSAEELRLMDYNIGQIRPPFAEPSVVSPFASRKTEHEGAIVTPLFGARPATIMDAHANCNAKLASKDAEIRLLHAKVIILEDRLQRANDTPQFGKSGLERPSLFMQSPTPEGPRKGDPSIPINPDPSTNNTGLDLTVMSNTSQPKATRDSGEVRLSTTDEGNQTFLTKVLPPAADSAKTSSNKVSDEVALAKTSVATTEDTRLDGFEERILWQSQRMENIESQLQKVTALLEKQALSSDDITSSRAAIDRDITTQKGKGRVEEDEVESGASTPAVIVYTPGSSNAEFSDDEIDAASLLNITDKNKESVRKICGEEKVTKGGLSLNAVRVLQLLEEEKDQMHITSVAKVCKLTIRDASAAVEQLLKEKYVAAVDGQDSYIYAK